MTYIIFCMNHGTSTKICNKFRIKNSFVNVSIIGRVEEIVRYSFDGRHLAIYLHVDSDFKLSHTHRSFSIIYYKI